MKNEWDFFQFDIHIIPKEQTFSKIGLKNAYFPEESESK